MGFLASMLSIRNTAKTAQQPVHQRRMWPGKHAGVRVDEDSALTYSAVWACVRVISETIAALPWNTFRRIDKDNSKKVEDSINWMLYRQPNPEISSFTLREIAVAWALTWGNGYAEIERDGAGRPVYLWPIPPHRVTPERNKKNELVYTVSNERGPDVTLPYRDVYHLHGLGYDGITGYSVVSMAAKSIGLGLACEMFGSNYFSNGMHPSAVVSHPTTIGENAFKRLKETLNESYSGLGNTHRLMLLEEAMKIEKMSFSPEDSQFLDTRKFQVAEIARWFRMPLHKISDLERSTNNNIEHQGIEFVTDTISPWATRIETEGDIKFFGSFKGRRYTKLNLNSLMRGDSKSRSEFYKTMANLGAFSVNDILRLEDMNTIGSDGDKRLVQLNQTTLEKIGTVDVEQKTPQVAENNEEQLQMIVLTAATDIVSRETKRALSAVERYPDRVEMAAWIENFTGDHVAYIRRKLQTPCDALAKIYQLSEETVDKIIDLFVSRHVRTMRDNLFKPDEENDISRAQDIVEFITEQSKQAAMLERMPL